MRETRLLINESHSFLNIIFTYRVKPRARVRKVLEMVSLNIYYLFFSLWITFSKICFEKVVHPLRNIILVIQASGGWGVRPPVSWSPCIQVMAFEDHLRTVEICVKLRIARNENLRFRKSLYWQVFNYYLLVIGQILFVHY